MNTFEAKFNLPPDKSGAPDINRQPGIPDLRYVDTPTITSQGYDGIQSRDAVVWGRSSVKDLSTEPAEVVSASGTIEVGVHNNALEGAKSSELPVAVQRGEAKPPGAGSSAGGEKPPSDLPPAPPGVAEPPEDRRRRVGYIVQAAECDAGESVPEDPDTAAGEASQTVQPNVSEGNPTQSINPGSQSDAPGELVQSDKPEILGDQSSTAANIMRRADVSRSRYMTGEGFLYLTDIHNRIMDDITTVVPERVVSYDPHVAEGARPEHLEENPSGLNLYLAARKAGEPIHELLNKSGSADFVHVLDTYSIPAESRSAISKHSPYHGLLDLDFTWYFAPAVANAIAEEWQQEGSISAGERSALTLTDWANVVGSEWFGKLMHSMATTAPGMYRFFGREADAYKPGALGEALSSGRLEWQGDRLFDTVEQYDPDKNRTYLTAKASPSLRRALRDARIANPMMAEPSEPSAGCPVARYRTSIPRETLETNTHLQNLIGSGTLRTVPQGSDNEKIMVEQDLTAIDHSLRLLSSKLKQYDELYGSPRVQEVFKSGAVRVEHVLTSATDSLNRRQRGRDFLKIMRFRGGR